MSTSFKNIDWDHFEIAVPAFLVIIRCYLHIVLLLELGLALFFIQLQ